MRAAGKKRLRSIMFVGTGSDVGKSIIATGVCRILFQDGYTPAPFKAQNMALNSYATPDGLEIGRAQAVQAEAAGIAACTDMNPILLKPSSEQRAQVILHGRVVGNQDACEYFRSSGREHLRGEVYRAYDRLRSLYNPIVLEGAGSISELNLLSYDLVNMSMADYADASVVLVADIDRGGVFASVYGSIILQRPEYRRRIKGIVINKFRGDLSLFEEGREQLERLCGVPVLGVVPYFTDIHIDEEDSVALKNRSKHSRPGQVNIAVILLSHISNYTDFARLEADSRVHLYYTNTPEDLDNADIIIIPGTKSTIADLIDLRKNGMAQAILSAYKKGKTILGICGGYQMMGHEVLDPDGIEGTIACIPALGLLPITTTMACRKVTRQRQFHLRNNAADCLGYEIHMGRTSPVDGAPESPLCYLEDGGVDGYWLSDHCMGTYLHGFLDNPIVIDYLLAPMIKRLSPANGLQDYVAYRQEQYDKLAKHLRRYLDIDALYQMMHL